MEIRIIVDDAAIERVVRKVLERMQGKPAAPERRAFLVNCPRPADLLKVAEAPDTEAAGVRAEPHWRVLQEIREGDLLLFRDRRGKAIAGHAAAARRETGEDRHRRGVPAVRWWTAEPVAFDPPLPDAAFVAIFEAKQTTTPGFPLLRRDGTFAQKAYAYPLDAAVIEAVLAEAATNPAQPPEAEG